MRIQGRHAARADPEQPHWAGTAISAGLSAIDLAAFPRLLHKMGNSMESQKGHHMWLKLRSSMEGFTAEGAAYYARHLVGQIQASGGQMLMTMTAISPALPEWKILIAMALSHWMPTQLERSNIYCSQYALHQQAGLAHFLECIHTSHAFYIESRCIAAVLTWHFLTLPFCIFLHKTCIRP